MFESLGPMPPDSILGLMQAFREDPRPGKIDLGVGVYKDANGETPVLSVVKKAERQAHGLFVNTFMSFCKTAFTRTNPSGRDV